MFTIKNKGQNTFALSCFLKLLICELYASVYIDFTHVSEVNIGFKDF